MELSSSASFYPSYTAEWIGMKMLISIIAQDYVHDAIVSLPIGIVILKLVESDVVAAA